MQSTTRSLIGMAGLLLCLTVGGFLFANCATNRKEVAAAGVVVGIGGEDLQGRSDPGRLVVTITNRTGLRMLISQRAVVTRTESGWQTNYSDLPRFVGEAGAGSAAPTLELESGEAKTVALAPVDFSKPFYVEFVCFPQRSGVEGAVDSVSDKASMVLGGTETESFLGKSFYMRTPVVDR